MSTILDAKGLSAAERVDQVDWDRMVKDLADGGSAVARQLLTPEECEALTALYPQSGLFRSRVVMARYAFGKGEYQYFSYPLPDLVGGGSVGRAGAGFYRWGILAR